LHQEAQERLVLEELLRVTKTITDNNTHYDPIRAEIPSITTVDTRTVLTVERGDKDVNMSAAPTEEERIPVATGRCGPPTGVHQ
jgi:hypothetical protein